MNNKMIQLKPKAIIFYCLICISQVLYAQKPGSLEDNTAQAESSFIRGSQIIFQDNFENETIGSFPSKWSTNKSGEVKKLSGLNNKFLKIAENAVVNVQLTKPLPISFTVEFDVIIPDDVPMHLVSFGFGSKLFAISWLLSPKEGYVFSLQTNKNHFSEGLKFGTQLTPLKEVSLKKTDYTTPLNTVIKVGITVNDKHIICYIDGKKMVDQPTAFDASFRNNFFFNATTHGAAESKLNYFYISNVVIAQAGMATNAEVKNEVPLNNNTKPPTQNNNQTQLPTTTTKTPQTIYTPLPTTPLPTGVVAITGFNFEQGKASLSNWTKEGTAFNNQPTYGNNVLVRREMDNPVNPFKVNIALGGDYWKDLSLPIGHKGKYWIGSFENRSDSTQMLGRVLGNIAKGALTSPTFTISKKFISFLIGGVNDLSNANVELIYEKAPDPKNPDKNGLNNVGTANTNIDKTTRTIFKETGKGSNVMRRVWWDVSRLIGKQAQIKITDNTDNGNINTDDFIFQDTDPLNTDVAINSKIKIKQVFYKDDAYYDWDFPLWGTIDTHTHPASHIGFGNRLFHGEPVGNIETALADCEINHGADINRNLTNSKGETIGGNIVRNAVAGVFDEGHRLGIIDPGNKWGAKEQTLSYWPLYSTKLHQQMWKDWLKRAYDGGVKMIVALTVHNRLFARVSEGTRPDDDMSVGDKQINYIVNVIAPECSSWMEIAYSPMDMRRIMLSGKLAVILGTELDNIGNFDGRRTPTETEVRLEIRRLYNLGLRYMFPVHLIDNGFGGSAIKNDIFNLATKFNTGKPLTVELQDYKNGFSEFKLKAHWDMLHVSSAAVIGASNKAVAYGGIAGATTPLVLPVAAPVIMPFIPLVVGGAGTAIGMTAPLIPILASATVHKWTNDWGISLDVLPVGNNYPTYPWKRYAGHINAKGLTNAGEIAINEMMKLGVMIDIDHGGRKTVDGYFEKAFAVPNGGYPLNSGHNQFCETRWTEAQLMPGTYDLTTEAGRDLYTNHYGHIEEKIGNENDRMTSELEKIKMLGGMMGVGIAGANVKSAVDVIPVGDRKYIQSVVENNNPGSTKSAAQLLLFAIEKMKGSSVCFGTDINGFAGLVGPRFGANSASAAAEDLYDTENLEQYVLHQTNPVKYTPFTDLSGKRFRGKLSGSNDNAINHQDKYKEEGKFFSEEQGDFMMALQIYYAMDAQFKRNAEADETKNKIDWYLNNVVHEGYEKNKVKEFIKGLIKGGNSEGIGNDIGNGDVGTQQQIACKVSKEKIFGNRREDGRLSDVMPDDNKHKRYFLLSKAFDYYQSMQIAGTNEPLTPSSTRGKTWNYNIDGMAHYGMMVDFFQDLKNVGMTNKDMSVIFNSAEDFAKMWERCLRQSEQVR